MHTHQFYNDSYNIHHDITCHCATKLQQHHKHFQLFEFEIWMLAISESLCCSCFRHELRQGSRWFPTPRWQLYPRHAWSALDFQHQTRRKQSNVLLATDSSEEIEAAEKPIIVKNTQKSTVWAVMCSHHGQRCKTSVETGNASSKTSDTTELCHWQLHVCEEDQAWWRTAVYTT